MAERIKRFRAPQVIECFGPWGDQLSKPFNVRIQFNTPVQRYIEA